MWAVIGSIASVVGVTLAGLVVTVMALALCAILVDMVLDTVFDLSVKDIPRKLRERLEITSSTSTKPSRKQRRIEAKRVAALDPVSAMVEYKANRRHEESIAWTTRWEEIAGVHYSGYGVPPVETRRRLPDVDRWPTPNKVTVHEPSVDALMRQAEEALRRGDFQAYDTAMRRVLTAQDRRAGTPGHRGW